MSTRRNVPMRRLEKSLLAFGGLLIASLLIIFFVQPSIYIMALPPTAAPTERYPLPVLLFLSALMVFLGVLGYGVIHHWRLLFWLILVAFAGALVQIPVDVLQLMGLLANPYPGWYVLFRIGVGFIELGFVTWMIQSYRQHGVWGIREDSAIRASE